MSHVSRRAFVGGLIALPAAAVTAPAIAAPARVAMPGGYPSGTILVATGQRRLYLSLGDGSALTYPVAVGRPGKQWFGQRVITANTSARPGARPMRCAATIRACPM